MRLRRIGDEMVSVDDDGAASIVREGGEVPIEERDFRSDDDKKPLTRRQRRARISSLGNLIERPVRDAEREAFETFLRDGLQGLTPEQRAQTTDTSGGGYLIPAAYERQFIETMKQYDPILDIGTMFATPTGAAGDFPIDDDVVVGEVVAENATITQTDTTFASLPLAKCPKHSSKMLRVSLELLQDAFSTFETIIAPILARRLARSVSATAITKLLTDADVAVTTAAAGAVTGSEILDLMGAVDAEHAQVGSFVMNESVVTALKKQTSYGTAGNFPNMVGTDPEGRTTIFGKPVFSSPSMASIGANAKVVAFGNFRRFYVRTVARSLVLQSFPERYAEYAQSAFTMFWRAQGALAKSTNTPVPVRLLQCHS